MTEPTPARPPRPAFNAYALPLPRRREGPAAALSFLAHVTIAVLVLWRGAALFERGGGGGAGPRGGGGGGGRPAVSWFALPTPSAPQAQDVPAAVTVPILTVPLPDAVKIDVPVAPPPSLSTVVTPPSLVGPGAGTTGGPGQGPGTGGGQGTGTGPGKGVDSGSGSGGDGEYIVPAYVRGLIIPPDCARGEFVVRFWVEADGRVSRVDVNPQPKDAGCHRELIAQMKAYQFRPAKTQAGVPVASMYQIRLVH